MRVAGICLSAAWLCLGATLPDASFAVEAQLEAIVSQLSAGYGTQDSQRARFSWNGADHSLTQLGLEHKRAFGESAQIFVASHALDLNALDRVSVAVSGSDALTIAARWRIDGQYSRKLGAQRDVVASLGAFASSTADGHRDRSLIGSAAWYFADRQVVEGGLRLARSDPGNRSAARVFAVYDWGAVGQDTVSLRVEAGREAYQTLGANTAVANFASQELALSWRRWLGQNWGFGWDATAYSNPAYRKATLGLVLFFSL